MLKKVMYGLICLVYFKSVYWIMCSWKMMLLIGMAQKIFFKILWMVKKIKRLDKTIKEWRGFCHCLYTFCNISIKNMINKCSLGGNKNFFGMAWLSFIIYKRIMYKMTKNRILFIYMLFYEKKNFWEYFSKIIF